MVDYLPSLVLVIVAVIGVIGTWINGRNDRALAHQEANLIESVRKNDPDDPTASILEMVLRRRALDWLEKQKPSRQYLRRGFLEFLGACVFGLIAFYGIAAPGAPLLAFVGICIAIVATGVFLIVAFFTLKAALAEKGWEDKNLEDLLGLETKGELMERRRRRATRANSDQARKASSDEGQEPS